MGGPLGGPGKILGGQWSPGTPLAPPLITRLHQAGVNFENFTEVKFRDILLTGTGRRDRRLNRDCPGQTYGRSNVNQNLKPKSNFRFIRERPFAIHSLHQKCRLPRKVPPRGIVPPSRGPDYSQASSVAFC